MRRLFVFNPLPHRLLAFFMAAVLLCLPLCGCVTSATRATSEETSTAPEDLPTFVETDDRPRVALTFDDGPQHYDERTKKTVDELAKYGYTATFFVLGHRIPGGDAIAYAAAHGMEIGIHGYSHEIYYDKNCSEEAFFEEMNKTVAAIQGQVPGWEPKLMRPVGGIISYALLDVCPYAVIQWSVDSEDWKNKYNSSDTEESAQAKVDTIVNNILSQVGEGDIILMHDIYESTYDATVVLLARLYEMGYNVVSVSELLGETSPGVEYYKR